MSVAADLLVLDALLPGQPPERRSCLAARGGRLVHVGEAGAAADWRGPRTVVLNAAGRRVLPGLHDCHLHFLKLGRNLDAVDLFEVPSVAEAQRRLAARLTDLPRGRWLTGRGWLQDVWMPAEFPTRADLDEVAPHHPVVLSHKSGHAAWVNSRALLLAGVTRDTPDPEGGVIVRDGRGEPTGVLLENAMDLVWRHLPEATLADDVAALRAAQALAHRVGLTAVQCCDGRRSLAAFQTLHEAGDLRLRVTSHLSGGQLDGLIAVGLRTGFGDDWLRLGHLKLFADGALGSVTAWMVDPYEGRDDCGVCTTPPEELRDAVLRASAAGIPAAVHAIGDRACREVLDIFEAARVQEEAAAVPPPARRHRVEHCQVLTPIDLPRLAALQVIASMQPIHATQDLHLVDRWWGARGRYAYAFRDLLDTGARLAFGSDAPVEDPNPFVGLHAAVTRRRADGTPGPDGWYPEQRLTWREALAGFTTGAAFSVGREADLGRLEVGCLADLVIANEDPERVDPMALGAIRPVATVVGGEVVYQAE